MFRAIQRVVGLAHLQIGFAAMDREDADPDAATDVNRLAVCRREGRLEQVDELLGEVGDLRLVAADTFLERRAGAAQSVTSRTATATPATCPSLALTGL